MCVASLFIYLYLLFFNNKTSCDTRRRTHLPRSKKLWDVLAASWPSSWINSTQPSNSCSFKSLMATPRTDSGRKHTGCWCHFNCFVQRKWNRVNNVTSSTTKKEMRRNEKKNIIKCHFYCSLSLFVMCQPGLSFMWKRHRRCAKRQRLCVYLWRTRKTDG